MTMAFILATAWAWRCAGWRSSISSSGQQPIHNADRTAWIVFNGEIYNYRELRAQLEKRGHQFYTNSDTEAIVHAYDEYGTDCPKHLRGMFALAIWDERNKSLFLARDRVGKKPLLYAQVDGDLVFGSEFTRAARASRHQP